MPQAPLWLQNLTVVRGPDQTIAHAEALLGRDGVLLGLDQDAADQAQSLGLSPIQTGGWVLGPSLVDPHSVLENPLLGRAETLISLVRAAAQGGYGQVALLPWGDPPRDHPDRLQLPSPALAPRVHLWGSLDRGTGGQDLSPHSELLAAGAIGLASAAVLPTSVLLERSLQLGELGDHPLLLAPR
ncbi:MAG: dihydroorotase, partial [Synechococcaceae bacterium WBB_10_009]|nr:dihydroorotase [Synechococcaceae bacterium WBB_10_009]